MIYNFHLKTLYIALRKEVQLAGLPPILAGAYKPTQLIECIKQDGMKYSINCPFVSDKKNKGNILKLSED